MHETRPTAAIRAMRPEDVEAASEAILRADWGDRRSWFEFATTQPACRPVVAEIDGAVVGTGVGTANGEVGWVGTIWVDPAHRGAGIGRDLTAAVVDGLEAMGCATLLLVATDEGRPMYERLGFELQAIYRILEAPGLAAGDPMTMGAATTGAVRAFEPRDLEAIVALDRTATGEDRTHAIRRFAAPATTRVLERDGDVAGFVIRAPWGGGATIAPEPADAMLLLDARRRASGPDGRVRVGIVDANVAGLAALEVAGLLPIWSAPRMVRGAPLRWEPGWIWGQFNHAIG